MVKNYREIIYTAFSNWVDKHLSSVLPNGIVAINFNLYEGSGKTFDVEIIGSDCFAEDDGGDWACSEIFTTREDLFSAQRTKSLNEWEKGLLFVTSLVEKYLQEGEYAEKLKGYEAVGIGFVDGDITILHQK